MTTPPVTTITDELLAELEQLAGKATPGPWGWDGPVWGYDRENEAPWLVQELGVKSVITGELNCNEQDAAFLAAANPATILALLQHVRELRVKTAPVVVPDDFVCESKPLQDLLNATAMLIETPCQDSATYWAAMLENVEALLKGKTNESV